MNAPLTLAQVAQEWPSASEADRRLLDFVGSLILDVARNHSRVDQAQVANWLAKVAVGQEWKASR